MSVVFSGTNQGVFTSTGTAKTLQIRSDVDWMMVWNLTAAAQATADLGFKFYWQRGMTQGRGIVETKLGTVANDPVTVGQIAANSGFFLVDSSLQTPGAAVALTGITNATPPVVNTGSTAGLVAGDVVRIFDTAGAQQLGGIDFTIGSVVTNTSFTLAYMRAIANANPGAGTYRKIPFDPIFYPRARTISKISQATQAIVTLTVTHGYTVGQEVRFVIPTVTATAFGMTQLDGVKAKIVAVGQADVDMVTNTITVDVDTTAFTAFAWPLTADPGFTPPQIVPVGMNTAQALSSNVNILADATENQAYIGMILAAGNASPAGNTSDQIFWVAGKSFSNTTT